MQRRDIYAPNSAYAGMFGNQGLQLTASRSPAVSILADLLTKKSGAADGASASDAAVAATPTASQFSGGQSAGAATPVMQAFADYPTQGFGHPVAKAMSSGNPPPVDGGPLADALRGGGFQQRAPDYTVPSTADIMRANGHLRDDPAPTIPPINTAPKGYNAGGSGGYNLQITPLAKRSGY